MLPKPLIVLISVCEALFAAGAHPKTIVAFLREQTDLTLSPCFSELPIEDCGFEEILKQGGKDAPFAWNIFLAWLLDKAAAPWIGKQYGIDLESRRITHVTWSENVFLFAKNSKDLKHMLVDLSSIFGAHNQHWNTSEMFFWRGGFSDKRKRERGLVFLFLHASGARSGCAHAARSFSVVPHCV